MNNTLTNPTGQSKMNGKPVMMAEVKTIINFESGFAEKLLCDGPTFSTGTSCVYSCNYCYVQAIMSKNTAMVEAKKLGFDHGDVVVRRKSPVEIVRQQLTNKDGTPKFTDPNDTRVIYASPLVDVAANMELVRETIEICKTILSLTPWHIRLLSKSNLLPKIAQGLEGFCASEGARKRIIYGVSTGTLDDKLAKAIEPDCPLVSKRIESLHWLQYNGYRTFGMICPSLPLPPKMFYEVFSESMARALRAYRCEHVWAEVMNARGEAFANTILALRNAGYEDYATELDRVSTNRLEWEDWARTTFEAHARELPEGKLRFLQYVNKNNIDYWRKETSRGAVLLGEAAHAK